VWEYYGIHEIERMVQLTIYTVRSGDSLYSIARKFQITASQLIFDNQLSNPEQLVIGQALVVQVDSVYHTVSSGESIYSIARSYQTTVDRIMEANPSITNPSRIYVGQVLTIPFENEILGSIDVNGFVIGISNAVLGETLPYLTYISIFSYQTDLEGNLTQLNESNIITAARNSNVAPMMTVTNIRETGGFSSDIAHAILTNQAAQDTFMENVIATLREKNYYGLIIDFEYVYPFDRLSYNQFLRRVVDTLHPLGYVVGTALAPKISAEQVGTLYQAHDYPVHGRLADFVIIMTYEWGYTYGPAMAVAPVDQVRRVLDYAVSVMPPGKILMGMPNYGYDWTLPFVQGSAASVITNTGAVTLASNVRAPIKFDERSQAPFFNYYDAQGRRHEVWFDDARSIQARLRLVNEYGLAGVSYWTLDTLFRTQFLVLQSMYSVNKVL
jgi:spore germination protein